MLFVVVWCSSVVVCCYVCAVCELLVFVFVVGVVVGVFSPKNWSLFVVCCVLCVVC